MRSALISVGLLVAIALPGLAVAGDKPNADSAAKMIQIQAWQSQISQQLVERGTVDTLTTAAVLRPVSMTMYDSTASKQERQSALHKDAAARLQLLERAAAAAPDAPDIAALALQVCTSVPGCDVGSHAERLFNAAPDDASYLLPALSDAQSRQDQDKVSAVLQSMAEATTFTTWYPTLRERLHRGIDDIAVPALPPGLPADWSEDRPAMTGAEVAFNTAVVMMFTTAGLPDYGTIGKACENDAPESLARQEACRQISVLLSRDSSLMSANIGLAFWRQNARDKADLAAATKATRKLDWQQQSLSEMTLDGTVAPLESFQATLDNDGEIPGMVALLKKYNVPTTPPKGWVSRREKFERAEPKASASHSSVCSGTP